MVKDEKVLKQKLFYILFKDNHIKPVMAISSDEAKKSVLEETSYKEEDIVSIELKECYYPLNEDNFPV